MARSEPAAGPRAARLLGLVAAVLTDLVVVLYLVLTVEEDEQDTARVMLVAGSLLVVSTLCVLGALGRDPTRRLALFAAAAGGLLMWGVLALLSVGMLLLAASVPVWAAAGLLVRSRQAELLPAVIAGTVAFMLPPILLSAV